MLMEHSLHLDFPQRLVTCQYYCHSIDGQLLLWLSNM